MVIQRVDDWARHLQGKEEQEQRQQAEQLPFGYRQRRVFEGSLQVDHKEQVNAALAQAPARFVERAEHVLVILVIGQLELGVERFNDADLRCETDDEGQQAQDAQILHRVDGLGRDEHSAPARIDVADEL